MNMYTVPVLKNASAFHLSSRMHLHLTLLFWFLSAIFSFVLEGNALKAIDLTEELAPNLLENDMDLHFDLLSLHFIELVRSRKW